MRVTEYRLAQELRLSTLAERFALELLGPDRAVVAFGGLATRSQERQRLLTYASTPAWFEQFERSDIGAAVVPRALAEALPAGRSGLAADNAEEAFYAAFAFTAETGLWERLSGRIDPTAHVARSAVVDPAAIVGPGCVIGPGAVLAANVELEADVDVQANATIGGDGFQVVQLDGGRTRLRHTGGVYVARGCSVGSGCCIDAGLLGDVTALGPETHLDNLINVAHGVVLGARVNVVATSGIMGSASVGDDAWLGPGVVVGSARIVGARCVLGAGAVVVRDVPAHALAFGNPARVAGWVCACRERLAIDADGFATCGTCSRRYRVDGDVLEPIVASALEADGATSSSRRAS